MCDGLEGHHACPLLRLARAAWQHALGGVRRCMIKSRQFKDLHSECSACVLCGNAATCTEPFARRLTV